LKAVYAFCVRSPGYAERWIGGVSRGQDLGIIKLEAALTLRGEIKIDDPESNETNQVSVQYRQANTAMGGDDGIQNWNSAKLVKNKDKLEFELGGLQSGRLDFYVVYHNPTKQKAFFGKITGDSQVKIERNGLVSLNDGFSGRQGSASASEQVPRANAPARVIHAYVPPKEFAITVDGKTPTEHANIKQKMLVYWSSSGAPPFPGVKWRVFITRDGTLFVPGGSKRTEAGIHHRMSKAEVDKLIDFLSPFRKQSGDSLRDENFNSWEQCYTTIVARLDDETFTWHRTEFDNDQHPVVAIGNYLSELISNASCGGLEQKEIYRQLASKALQNAVPGAQAFGPSDWWYTNNGTDGTREIGFSNDQSQSVRLVDPPEGPVFVDGIK